MAYAASSICPDLVLFAAPRRLICINVQNALFARIALEN
jgi:hypothetical protein